MKNDDSDELDGLINHALRGYSDASPLDGLESRILQRIHLADAGRRMRWLKSWWIAVPVAAGLILAGFVLHTSWKSAPDIAGAPTKPASPKIAVITPALPVIQPRKPEPIARRAAPKHRNHSGQERSRILPKKECFPTPAPLTPEERLLAVWTSRSPLEPSRTLAGLRKRADEPVSIQPIQIAPLQSNGVE